VSHFAPQSWLAEIAMLLGIDEVDAKPDHHPGSAAIFEVGSTEIIIARQKMVPRIGTMARGARGRDVLVRGLFSA